MNTLDTIEYKNGATIFVNGQKPYDSFFIVLKGNLLVQNHIAEKHILILKKGDILGLISAISKEPFFSTVTALTDVTLIKIKADDILSIKNRAIIYKIVRYLLKTLNIGMKKYFDIISNNICDKDYKPESLINIADYYHSKGYIYAAKHMYNTYLHLFNGFQKEHAKNMIEKIGNIKIKKKVGKHFIKYKKGACIFCEHERNNKVYLLKSGKVGLYKAFPKKRLTQMIITPGGIIGLTDALENKPKTGSVIVLEDSVVEEIERKLFIEKIEKNRSLLNYIIKFLAKRIFVLNIRIKSLYMKSHPGKLYNLIYSFSKMEPLYEKNKHHIKIPYNVSELMDMAGIGYMKKNNNLLNILKKSEYLEIENDNILIKDIDSLCKDLVYYK